MMIMYRLYFLFFELRIFKLFLVGLILIKDEKWKKYLAFMILDQILKLI